MIGTAIGKGYGDGLGPKRVKGSALVGGSGGFAPGSSCIFISSPEPKAHGELIVYRSIRRPLVCASVRP